MTRARCVLGPSDPHQRFYAVLALWHAVFGQAPFKTSEP